MLRTMAWMVARGIQVVFEINNDNVNNNDESDDEFPQVSIQSTSVTRSQYEQSHLNITESLQISVPEQMQSNMENFQG